MDISRIAKSILKNDPFNRKKNYEFSKKFKRFQFSMVQGSLYPNITFLGEKLWPVAWNKKKILLLLLYKVKMKEMLIKKRKNENFEEKKCGFVFSCPKDHSTQKLGSYV